MKTDQFLKQLADETRLRLLSATSQRELCVCELMEILALPQSTISRQLSQLKLAGILIDRRAGKWVYYRVNPALKGWQSDIIKAAVGTAKEDPVLAGDLIALQQLTADCGK